MRFLSALPLLLVGLLPVVLNAAGAHAQDMPKAVFTVLDYAQILKASEAAKDIRRQVKQYRDSFREAFQTDEHRLRQLEAELKRQRSQSSPEEHEKKRQDFRRQVIAAQRRGQNHKRQLDRAYKLAMDEVQRRVILIVKELTQEKGFTIVVDKSQVLFAERSYDITMEVMLRLNQALRTVSVPKPR